MSTFTVVSDPESLFRPYDAAAVSSDGELLSDSRARCASAVTALEQAAQPVSAEHEVSSDVNTKCTATVAGSEQTYYVDKASFGYHLQGDGREQFVVMDPRSCYVVR